MRNLRIHLTWAVAVLAVCIVFAYQTHAVGQATMARPTAVATVDLERVFDGLEERATVDAELVELAEQLKDEGDRQAEEIDALTEELEAYASGTDKHQQTLEQLQLLSLEYQAYVEFSRRKIDIEKALMLTRIYRGMKAAARSLAEGAGYDVIFVDDSVAELGSGNQTEVKRQISARRMLYTNPEVDLTDSLVAVMNEQYRAQANAGGQSRGRLAGGQP